MHFPHLSFSYRAPKQVAAKKAHGFLQSPKGVHIVDRETGATMDSSLPPGSHEPEYMPYTRGVLRRQQRQATAWTRPVRQPFAGLSSNRG